MVILSIGIAVLDACSGGSVISCIYVLRPGIGVNCANVLELAQNSET